MAWFRLHHLYSHSIISKRPDASYNPHYGHDELYFTKKIYNKVGVQVGGITLNISRVSLYERKKKQSGPYS